MPLRVSTAGLATQWPMAQETPYASSYSYAPHHLTLALVPIQPLAIIR